MAILNGIALNSVKGSNFHVTNWREFQNMQLPESSKLSLVVCLTRSG
jgi:hypothetical protein